MRCACKFDGAHNSQKGASQTATRALIRVGSGGGHPVRDRIIALPFNQKIKGRTVSDTIEDTNIGRVSATHSTARAQP